MPTSLPRHSVTETPVVAAALKPLRDRLGAGTPGLAELIVRGAEAMVRELEAKDRAREQAFATFVDRLQDGPQPDDDEIRRIRHTDRRP